jgi:Putative transposase
VGVRDRPVPETRPNPQSGWFVACRRASGGSPQPDRAFHGAWRSPTPHGQQASAATAIRSSAKSNPTCYLSPYTHRVAISNSRLVALDDHSVTFKWKDYRVDGPERAKLMTLDADEFIRRFLIHVLPEGFHRVRRDGKGRGRVGSASTRSNVMLTINKEVRTEVDAWIADQLDKPLSYPEAIRRLMRPTLDRWLKNKSK